MLPSGPERGDPRSANGSTRSTRTYDLLSDSDAEQASSANPLHEASFLYYLRTVPLKIGTTYHLNRYFEPDRNPIIVKVLRRETVTVPAGPFDAMVLQPTSRPRESSRRAATSRGWLSNDDRQVPLQLTSRLPIGSNNLYLTSANTALASANAR